MRRFASLQVGLVVACALASLSLPAGAQSAPTTVYGPWTTKGVPPAPPRKSFHVPDDEDVEFIVKDGMGQFVFANCVSEAPGQPVIRGEALPVGNGRALVCTTIEPPVSKVSLLMTQDAQRLCWKGAVSQYRTSADARLKVTVTKTSPTGPWTFRATSDQAWTVKQIQSAMGSVWPVWLDMRYQTVDLRPARNASCDGVF